jgi:hypothetical protein
VVPCAYEHFALMAGFGRPEDVDVQPSASLGESTCPKSIEVRP